MAILLCKTAAIATKSLDYLDHIDFPCFIVTKRTSSRFKEKV